MATSSVASSGVVLVTCMDNDGGGEEEEAGELVVMVDVCSAISNSKATRLGEDLSKYAVTLIVIARYPARLCLSHH